MLDLLADGDVKMIRLTEGFTITKTIVLEDGREVWINGNNKRLVADDVEGWLIEVTDGARLYLENATFDGGDGADENKLDGIIWVEKGSALTARRNTLQNAAVGFGVQVFEGEKVDEKASALRNNNRFVNVIDPVVFYDKEGDVL